MQLKWHMGFTAENTVWPLEPLFGPFYLNVYLRLDPGLPGWYVQECRRCSCDVFAALNTFKLEDYSAAIKAHLSPSRGGGKIFLSSD